MRALAIRMTRYRRRLLGAALAALFAATPVTGVRAQTTPGEAASKSPSPGIEVAIERGLLSVKLGRVSLGDALRAIGKEAGVRVNIEGDPGLVWPQTFAGVPLDEGIERLAGDNGLLMKFAPGSTAAEAARLTEVWVYSAAGQGGAGVASSTRTASRADDGYRDLAKLARGKRLQAVRRLARRKDEADVATLARVLSGDPDATIRRMSATALGNIGGEDAAGALAAALGDGDRSVRVRAIRGLRIVKGNDAAALLGEIATGDKDPEVRRTTVHFLGALDSEDARSALEIALGDPDAKVRDAATQALAAWRGAFSNGN